MQQDVDMIVELWSRVKPLVPAKDRLEAADAIVSVFDEFGLTDGLEDGTDGVDKPLAAAIMSLYGENDANEDDEDEY